MKAATLISILFLTQLVFAQDNRMFTFSGTVYDEANDKPIDAYVVDVYEGNTIIQTVASEKKGRFEVDLFGSNSYTIEIYKDGYYPKRVIVHTNVPPDIKKLSPMKFEVELFRKSDYEAIVNANAFATSVFDLPYVIFEYNEKLEDLHYREDYTKNIKQKYKELEN